MIDCTGSGDVDMSVSVKADAEGLIEGLSGRKMRLNPGWANPSGDWRVGSKHAYTLFSRGLVDRIKEERRRQWDERQRVAIATAVADLSTAKAALGERRPVKVSRCCGAKLHTMTELGNMPANKNWYAEFDCLRCWK